MLTPLFPNAVIIRDVTEHLQLLLRKAGYHFHTTAEKEIVRIIKEKTCYLPLFPAKEEKDAGGKNEDFMLPDGNVIKVRTFTCALPSMDLDMRFPTACSF